MRDATSSKIFCGIRFGSHHLPGSTDSSISVIIFRIPASQVYITDRSRASTYDFIVLFCGAPSYGVGQENEIATQAGVPAIRLIPTQEISRMMIGSFVRAIDIKYSGSLETGISFGANELSRSFQEIRRIYFRHRALYRGLNKDSFGNRLKRLVD